MSRFRGRDWLFPALWGAWLGTLALIALIAAGGAGGTIVPALLGGAALVVVVGAALRAITAREIDERVMTQASPAPIVIATGATVALNGVAFGAWLFMIGGEIAAFGVFMMLREGRARP